MTTDKKLIQQILDSVNVHSLIFRRNRIILANSLALDWLSLSQDALTSRRLTELIHPSSYETALRIFNSLSSDINSASARLLIRHPVSGNIWIDTTVKSAPYFNDKHYGIATFNPSINSQADNVDIQSRVKIDILDDKTNNEPLTELTNIIEGNEFFDTALEDFLTTLRDIVPYDSASIGLVENNVMRFVAARGFSSDLHLSDLQLDTPGIRFKTSEILYETPHGKVQVIDDTSAHPHWVHTPNVSHIKSWMGVELRYNNHLLGYLNIDSSSPNYFTRDHARYAMALAGQAIVALVYTRLYQKFYEGYEEKQRLQHILVQSLINIETMYGTQELLFSTDDVRSSLPSLIDIVSASIDASNIIIIIFNIATGKLIHKLQSDTGTDNIWSIFTRVIGQENLPEDTMPAEDLKLPDSGLMVVGDDIQTTIGIINRRGAILAVRDTTEKAFEETDHEIIMTIASQISIALENERLNNQVKQQKEHLERLVERRTSQLSVERKRLKAILDSTAEGIFYMENFKIQYANPAFCRMVGYELEQLYNKPLSFIRVNPNMSEQHNFSELLDNPMEVELGRSETRLKHRDDTEFYASIRFSLVGHPGENPVRMVAIARDISQERKLYIQRARFIANAAHELRTPLSSLVLRLHMLRRQPERMSNHLQSLDQVTNYLKELVEELLTLSRFERGSIVLDKDQFSLKEILQQAIAEHTPFANENQVVIHTDLPEDPVSIKVDGKRIHQMLSNLVLNAINYSSADDNVHVKLAIETDPVGNQNAVIHVIDEGAGIEPDLLPDDIFEPFARPSGGSRKETGMGLALVREIVTLHGGSVHAKSQLNEGATFRVILPLN